MIIIGENINGTIPKIKKLILEQDGDALAGLATKQEEAGANLIDVNVGTGEGTSEDEADAIRWLVEKITGSVKCNLCIDSADPLVLRAGLEASGGRAGLINSVKATDENIAEVMPLAAEFKVPVIALAMDEGGIPKDSISRLKACDKIAVAAEGYGISVEDIYFDPLVMPVSTDITQGMTTLETIGGIKKEIPGAKTVLALSNVSFGLPKRTLVNQAMVHMAQYLGVDALIINPLDSDLMTSIKAAEAVLGRDRHCRKYSRASRS